MILSSFLFYCNFTFAYLKSVLFKSEILRRLRPIFGVNFIGIASARNRKVLCVNLTYTFLLPLRIIWCRFMRFFLFHRHVVKWYSTRINGFFLWRHFMITLIISTNLIIFVLVILKDSKWINVTYLTYFIASIRGFFLRKCPQLIAFMLQDIFIYVNKVFSLRSGLIQLRIVEIDEFAFILLWKRLYHYFINRILNQLLAT